MKTPETLTGLVIGPDDPGYDEARLDYNTGVPPVEPRYIVFTRSVGDVRRAIRFARRRGYPLRVRSGRHSYEAYSVVERGIVIDVTPLDQVVYDRDAGLAWIGAGARLSDIYQKLWDQARVTIPGGSCGGVGIAGLTLGGGFGLLGREYGLTCDALKGLKMVNADGEVVKASRRENKELFWASCGGGGGNFGAVTEFAFEAKPVGDVTIFYLQWPWSELAPVFAAFQLWADPMRLDFRMTPLLKLTSKITGQVALVGQFDGPFREALGLLAPMIRVGHPHVISIREVPFIEAVLYFGGGKEGAEQFVAQGLPTLAGTPAHEMFKNTSAYQFKLFGPEAIKTMIRYLAAAPNPASLVQFDGMGGHVGKIPNDATAFSHRGARASLQYQTYWTDPAIKPESVRWVEAFRRAMLPFTQGAYVNYIDGDIVKWPLKYYDDNLRRLIRVKKVYDPDNVFTFPQGLSQLTVRGGGRK